VRKAGRRRANKRVADSEGQDRRADGTGSGPTYHRVAIRRCGKRSALRVRVRTKEIHAVLGEAIYLVS
jgi:hypothetical protein